MTRHILLCMLISAAAVAYAVASAAAQDGPAPAGDAAAGAAVFKRCMACHQVGPDARNGVGPALSGVVDRLAATVPGYNYSAAMRKSGLVWDQATLATFLRAPRKLVPGTRMTFAGLGKDQEISDVIAYLRTPGAQ